MNEWVVEGRFTHLYHWDLHIQPRPATCPSLFLPRPATCPSLFLPRPATCLSLFLPRPATYPSWLIPRRPATCPSWLIPRRPATCPSWLIPRRPATCPSLDPPTHPPHWRPPYNLTTLSLVNDRILSVDTLRCRTTISAAYYLVQFRWFWITMSPSMKIRCVGLRQESGFLNSPQSSSLSLIEFGHAPIKTKLKWHLGKDCVHQSATIWLPQKTMQMDFLLPGKSSVLGGGKATDGLPYHCPQGYHGNEE